LGLGLSMGLDSFAFRLQGGPPAAIALHAGADGAYPAAHWRCLLLHLDGGRGTLAAALPAVGGARFRVVLHAAGEAPEPLLAASTAGAVLVGVQRVAAAGHGTD
jgi:hypothetical protein